MLMQRVHCESTHVIESAPQPEVENAGLEQRLGVSEASKYNCIFPGGVDSFKTAGIFLDDGIPRTCVAFAPHSKRGEGEWF